MKDDPTQVPASEDGAEEPGVPGFRSWRGVYAFVLGLFVLDVVLLAAFTRWFR